MTTGDGREFFRLDLLTPERRRAWQECADRNQVTLSELVRGLVDRAARFEMRPDDRLPWEPFTNVFRRVPRPVEIPVEVASGDTAGDSVVCLHPERRPDGWRWRCVACGDFVS